MAAVPNAIPNVGLPTTTAPAVASPSAAAGAPSTSAAASAAAEPAWFSSIEDEGLRGWTESKGWKSPAEMAKSARELEGLRGVPAERLLKLPDKDTGTADEWGQVYARLGRPEKPEDYKLADAKGNLSDPFAAALAPVMHAEGITAKQATALNKVFNEFATQWEAGEATRVQQEEAADLATLDQEWPGALNVQNKTLAKRGAEAYGLNEEQLGKIMQALGVRETYRLFMRIGAGQAEAGFEIGSDNNRSFVTSPEAATAIKREKMADKEWSRKALMPGTAEAAELDRLQKIETAGRGNSRRI